MTVMKIPFYKFDGAGNDFVIIDARNCNYSLSTEQIAHICHRRFGVGADGLMLLLDASGDYDFVMKYYNSDGRPAEMCGNGGRCIAMFAHLLGIGAPGLPLRFSADDGPHYATIQNWDPSSQHGIVRLSMRDVDKASIRPVINGRLLNTGVPHYVQEVEDIDAIDVQTLGCQLRHHPDLGPAGANVNFIQLKDHTLWVRTYERGVEDETLACGTGVTACALVSGCRSIQARGGSFEIDCSETPSAFTNVMLIGPVSLNFIGNINIIC